ncbi:hypothetical protein L9F63_021721, partial [Diploptera punctata]
MVANVQAAFERSPRKSLRRASRELQIPKSTLQRLSTNASNCTHIKCSKVNRHNKTQDGAPPHWSNESKTFVIF